jgi:hypothetical protein
MKCEICGKELGELQEEVDYKTKNPVKQLKKLAKESSDRFLQLNDERKTMLRHIWTDHHEIVDAMSGTKKKVFLRALKIAGVDTKT